MREGPDLARIAALVGDPARANMLTALMGGAALTASELALEAGVSLPTASSHLAKLSEGGLLAMASQGRHRYFSLSGPQIAGMLEAIMGVAAAVGPKRARPGPKDEAMREARVCYDHLAGAQAVRMFDRFVAERIIIRDGESVSLGRKAAPYFAARGIDVDAMATERRPLCRSCLDWSVRRSHLAGAVGAAVLDRILAQKWARKEPGSRVVRFTPAGRQAFARTFLR
jgi:DNA-binding transcriptional ArsR family regulator